MKILNTRQVKKILKYEPEAEFSLQPVRVEIEGGGMKVVGYHIFEGQLPRMIHVKGDEIWKHVARPGPPNAE